MYIRKMNEQEKKIHEYKLREERVVRWDKYRIDLFTYTNNLFVVLNLAFLGYYTSQSGLRFHRHHILSDIQAIAFLSLVVSFIGGITVTLIRLSNFRRTAKLTKLRKKEFEHEQKQDIEIHSEITLIKNKIASTKSEIDLLDKLTWVGLRLQIWLFLIGCTFGVLYMLITNNTCL